MNLTNWPSRGEYGLRSWLFFSGEYGLVEKISGLTNQFVRFRFKGKKCDTIISPENVMFEIED